MLVLQQSTVQAIEGKAIFDNIAFVGTPGATKQKFFVKTTAINPFIITDILKDEPKTYQNVIATFNVDFRLCIEGEEYVDN